MSITERMENDGLSFADAAAKESLATGDAPLTLVQALRVEAADALAASKTCSHEPARPAFASMGRLLTHVADRIEAQDKRFAEHLEAWKANNAYLAARIEELAHAIHRFAYALRAGEGVSPMYYLRTCDGGPEAERALRTLESLNLDDSMPGDKL